MNRRLLRCARCHRLGSRKFTRDGTATVCSNTRACVMRQSHRLFNDEPPWVEAFRTMGWPILRKIPPPRPMVSFWDNEFRLLHREH